MSLLHLSRYRHRKLVGEEKCCLKCSSSLLSLFDFASCVLCSTFLVSYLVSSPLSFFLSLPPHSLPLAVDVSSPSEETKAQQTVIVSEPESPPADTPAAPPSDPAPTEVSEVVGVTDQDAPAALLQGNVNLKNQTCRTRTLQRLCEAELNEMLTSAC